VSVDEEVNARLEPHGWRWDRERASLRKLRQNDVFYTVPLFDMQTSADMLDWIFQLRQKTWVSDAEMGAIVFALDELLQPQAHLCTSGKERGPVDVCRILERNA
jgi:hypothetical protein